jgi:hypothetical protein
VSPNLRGFIYIGNTPLVREVKYGLYANAILRNKCEKDWGKRKEAHVKGKGGTKKIKPVSEEPISV